MINLFIKIFIKGTKPQKDKVKAFTIVELIITFIIITILGSLVAFVILNFRQYFGSYMENSLKTNEAMLFLTTMQRDFDRSKLIRYQDGKLLFKSIQGKTIQYTIGPEDIIREDYLKKDSFKLRAYIKNTVYQSELTKSIEILDMEIILKLDTICRRLYVKNSVSEKINEKIIYGD